MQFCTFYMLSHLFVFQYIYIYISALTIPDFIAVECGKKKCLPNWFLSLTSILSKRIESCMIEPCKIKQLENKAKNTVYVVISCLCYSKIIFKTFDFKCRLWDNWFQVSSSVFTTVLCRWCFWHCPLFQYQGGTRCSYSRVWGIQWKEILACKEQVKYHNICMCAHVYTANIIWGVCMETIL